MNPSPLRSRIFTLLGIAAILPLTSTATADTGDTAAFSGEECLANDDGVCLDETAALARFGPKRCEVLSVDGPGTFSDGECCYPVTESCPPAASENPCGCYGRPFVLEDRPVQAPADARADWSRGPSPSLTGLSDAQRARLARFWTENGLSEHSSVAGFARFVLDLCAHGAPPDLVRRALVAGVEETAHARACFALASAYAELPVGPGPLAMHGAAPVARTLVELARHTAREGAVGETLSAYIAGEMFACATDPAVREVLAEIVRDEARHAELAWATLKWAVEVGGDPVRKAVAEVLADAGLVVPDDEGADPVLEGHGLVSAARLRRCVAEGVRTVVAPAAAALVRRRGVGGERGLTARGAWLDRAGRLAGPPGASRPQLGTAAASASATAESGAPSTRASANPWTRMASTLASSTSPFGRPSRRVRRWNMSWRVRRGERAPTPAPCRPSCGTRAGSHPSPDANR
jgi:hypothetical protein